MLSDAALYQSTSHPEKTRLVFNTQLHQALKSIAKNREIVPVTPNATNTTRPVLSLHDPYGSGSSFGRSTELNGWDLEKKMVALQEVRDLLARPFFFYSDWATQAAAAAKNAPASLEKRMNYYSYFGKTLPLELGQSTLLDLWDYLMDMCEYVPVRNRCRSLYLHVAACICRRVEFIEGYDIDGEKIHLSEQVNQRYHKLLERCMQLCAMKLNKSRFLADDHKLFIAHIYAAAYFRFPFTTPKILTAVLDTTAILERVDNDGDDNNKTNGALGSTPPTSPKAGVTVSKRPRRKSTLRGYRSPRGHCRNWNALSGNEESGRSSNRGLEELKRDTFASFEHYKTNRSTDDLLSEKEASSFRKGARSVDASLEHAFQQMMTETTEQQETQFFDHLPLLYIGNAIESTAFSSPAFGISKDALEDALEPFLDRLITPGRDDLIGVTFVAAFLSDISSWCSHRKEWTMATMPWHCIPGYFAAIRLFVAVFRLMCQRRPRMAAMPAPANSVGRILSIVEGSQSSTTSDPWLSYWTAREAEVVLDTAAEALKNEYLVNVLVKIVLETTNMHDPVSVNYSFGILQRVLEIAAKAAATASSSSSENPKSEGKPAKTRTPHRLSPKFDDTYFLAVMRRALQSAHVQILLKVLTCLYNSIDLFPARVRKHIIGELILRENFFRFFMHWNEEIRKIYSYIVVFKTLTSNRLDLPCASDRIMLAHSPYFEATANGSSSSSLSPASAAAPTSSSPSSASGYWTQLSDMAHAMLRANGLGALSDAETNKKNNAIGANALKRLLVWDASARLRKHRGSAHTTLFRDAMVDDELSVDLSIASKLDALFKMIAEQMEKANRTLKQKSVASSSGNSESGAHSYFPKELEAYVERGLSQYVTVLWEYYESAFETPNATLPPLPPTMQFTITMPMFTD
ncbi:Uncharacterized protein FI667_g1592, partial [Globisporangium splendens]